MTDQKAIMGSNSSIVTLPCAAGVNSLSKSWKSRYMTFADAVRKKEEKREENKLQKGKTNKLKNRYIIS